jgi:hypothetical protein
MTEHTKLFLFFIEEQCPFSNKLPGLVIRQKHKRPFHDENVAYKKAIPEDGKLRFSTGRLPIA